MCIENDAMCFIICTYVVAFILTSVNLIQTNISECMPRVQTDYVRTSESILQEKWELIPSFLRTKGLFNQHLASFNYFVDTEIRQILQANNRVNSDANPCFYLKYLQ